jgi:acyl-CoA reductase-like NAD-dependent aldehyde dehydrogenase
MSDFLKVVQAVKSANSVLPQWQKIEFEERLALFQKLPDLIQGNLNELAEAYAKDSGASKEPGLDLQLTIELVRKILESVHKSAQTGFNPVGLVGVITDSQNPFTSVFQRLVTALACGNAVIWKPSTKLKQTTQKTVEMFTSLNLPEGLLNMIEGEDEIALALIQHPAIHYVSLSGTNDFGVKAMSQASEHAKHLQLTLAARNPAIIFADADLDQHLESITRSFFDHHGLGRWRASRIFVQESVYKSFIERFKTHIFEHDFAYVGEIKDPDQRASFEKAYLQAIEEKGKDLLGSNVDQKPRFIYDLTHCSTLQQEEINGPMVTVSSFKYQFDAIKFANTSPLGRAAYIWSGDLDKANKVARKIEAGRVFLNSLPRSAMPDRFQAAKNSGFGGEGIQDLIELVTTKPHIDLM